MAETIKIGKRTYYRPNYTQLDLPFLTLYKVVKDRALHELNGSELKVWLYNIGHKIDFENNITAKSQAKKLGIDEKTVRNAINNLIKKGYIEECEDGTYFIYDAPPHSIDSDIEMAMCKKRHKNSRKDLFYENGVLCKIVESPETSAI